MESKVCVVCKTYEIVDSFYNKYRKCKQCIIQRSLKHYFENEDKLSNQRSLYYDKKKRCNLRSLS